MSKQMNEQSVQIGRGASHEINTKKKANDFGAEK